MIPWVVFFSHLVPPVYPPGKKAIRCMFLQTAQPEFKTNVSFTKGAL